MNLPRSRRRLLAALLLPLLFPFTVHAEPITVGVTLSSYETFLAYMRGSMVREAAARHIKVQFEDANHDVGKQVSQVQNFIAQRVAAIIVNPADTSATKRISAMARQAGIPLVYVNRKPLEKMGDGVAFVGSDSLVAGRLQMEELARRMHGKGTLAIMVGELSTDAAQDRTSAVKAVVKRYPGITIVQEQVADFDRKKGIDLMSKWLSAGVRMDAIAANNDEMALGALLAMKQANVAPSAIIVAGVDATPDALASMRAKELAFTVFQDADKQGVGAIDVALRMVNKQAVEPLNMIPYRLVTLDNIASYSGNK